MQRSHGAHFGGAEVVLPIPSADSPSDTGLACSETTKDRFIGMYHIQDRIRSPELFSATILELVKLVQAGLYVFGKNDNVRDGLLCDVTAEGLQSWIRDVGEPYLDVQVSKPLLFPCEPAPDLHISLFNSPWSELRIQ